jgi:hypothetical protein
LRALRSKALTAKFAKITQRAQRKPRRGNAKVAEKPSQKPMML